MKVFISYKTNFFSFVTDKNLCGRNILPLFITNTWMLSTSSSICMYHIARASITLAESCSHFCVQIYACIYVATLYIYNHPFHLLHASNIINLVSLLQILYMYTQHACKNNFIYVHTHHLLCTMHIYAYVYMTHSEQCGTMPPFRMLYVVQYIASQHVNMLTAVYI